MCGFKQLGAPAERLPGRMEPHRIAETSAVKSGGVAPIYRAVNFAGKMLGKALLVLTLAAPASSVGAEVELYEPKHRSADELAVLLDPARGGDARVVADPGTGLLLLTGSAAELSTVRELLSRLDVPLPRYVVESRIESREALRLQGYSIDTPIQLGTLQIARLRDSRKLGTGFSRRWSPSVCRRRVNPSASFILCATAAA